MVSSASRKHVFFTCQITLSQRFAHSGSQRKSTPSSSKFTDHRNNSLRTALVHQGIQKEINDITFSSWKEGMRKQYSYSWEEVVVLERYQVCQSLSYY